MSTPSKKKKIAESPTTSLQAGDDIPTLPNDLLLLIFGELSTEERIPLGISSKRFREIDFELGKKSFDQIYLNWFERMSMIRGQNPTIKYDIIYRPRIAQYASHEMRIFRKAKAKGLNFWIEKAIIDQSEIDLLCTLTKTVRARTIKIHFESENCSKKFIPTILGDRVLENTQLYLNWGQTIPQNNIAHIRESLLTLPKINNLRLSTKNHGEYNGIEDILLDDQTLFHITSQVKYSELCQGVFTANGLLRVFEVVRKSELPNKYVNFYASKTTVIDELLSFPNNDFEKTDDELIDRNLSVKLENIPLEQFSYVQIGKIDSEDEFLFKPT